FFLGSFQGLSAKSKLSVEVKRGDSPYGPDLYGPIKIGSLLTLVLKLRGYSKEYDMRVAKCWAVEGPPLTAKYMKYFGYGPKYSAPRSIDMTNYDCSTRPKLIGNFVNVGVMSDYTVAYDYSHTIVKAANLKAFRFPHSDNVIIRCKVDVCYGTCSRYYGACKPVKLYENSKSGYGKYLDYFKTLIPLNEYEQRYSGNTVAYGSSDDGYGQPSQYKTSRDSYGAQPTYGEYQKEKGYATPTYPAPAPAPSPAPSYQPPYEPLYSGDYVPLYASPNWPNNQQVVYRTPSMPPSLPYQQQSMNPREMKRPKRSFITGKEFQVVQNVDSFIVEQVFSLDSAFGSHGEMFQDRRFRRAPDGSPTIKVGNSTEVWADCKDSQVTLKLDDAQGFQGSISLRSIADDAAEACEVERQIDGEEGLEMSLSRDACQGMDDIFIASVTTGNVTKSETIDCYTEEIFVGEETIEE
ncbi:unnamed protein product, partial [Notodromas monacha]